MKKIIFLITIFKWGGGRLSWQFFKVSDQGKYNFRRSVVIISQQSLFFSCNHLESIRHSQHKVLSNKAGCWNTQWSSHCVIIGIPARIIFHKHTVSTVFSLKNSIPWDKYWAGAELLNLRTSRPVRVCSLPSTVGVYQTWPEQTDQDCLVYHLNYLVGALKLTESLTIHLFMSTHVSYYLIRTILFKNLKMPPSGMWCRVCASSGFFLIY